MLIQYPVWDLSAWGGGLLIALIATVHVYVAHFAVGGGFFLVWTERKALCENSTALLVYVKAHTRFFLLLTMVFGALTGVAIWFTIGLLNPGATAELIRLFVFAFAVEWVFFLCEIIALFIYHYTFDTMESGRHMQIGWIYAASAFLSLFIINGIIAFMLTPGKWPASGNWLHAFFNPTFVPALFFRFSMALILAGIFGLITAVCMQDKALQATLWRYCAKWMLYPFLLLVAATIAYAKFLPGPQTAMIWERSPEIRPFLKIFAVTGGSVFIMGCLMLGMGCRPLVKKLTALVLILLGFGFLGAFEWIREAGRRPYILYGLMYSNSVKVRDLEKIAEQGILASVRWIKSRRIEPDNQMEAGRELFKFMCSGCHSIGGPMHDIRPLTRKFSVAAMQVMLEGLGKVNNYMPLFPGTRAEKEALSIYIVKELNQTHSPVEKPVEQPGPRAFEQPGFDPQKDEYVLLAWCDQGLYFLSDNDRYFSLSPPGVDLNAQLIRRGESPAIISHGVEITYALEPGFEAPARQSEYWRHAQALTGKTLPLNQGLSGKGLQDRMEPAGEGQAFIAQGIPVVPYTSSGEFHPYPLALVTARERDSGRLLAATRCVLPVSTEMGCRHCHGGPWRVADTTGISDRTAEDILTVHDRIQGTRLLDEARKGRPRSCSECHASKGDASGRAPSGTLNLSAAMHGLHANYLTGRKGEACLLCHPDAPDGFTRGARDIHHKIGLDCTNCHGQLEDHAIGLLVNELNAGKKGAEILMKHLTPKMTDDINKISARKPWLNQPDCLSCHREFQPPDSDQVELNQWSAGRAHLFQQRTDEVGLRCPACHGSPHGLYPADNIFGLNRDNVQSVQYQGQPYPLGADRNCKVCHTMDMPAEIHHPNMLGMFRNR